MKAREVVAVVDALRERWPVLRRPLTWHGAQRLLAEERIKLLRLPMEERAKVLSMGRMSVIALNSAIPAREHSGYIAHEYGHIKLHAHDDGERPCQLAPCTRGDRRELEAKLFARLLLLGPDVTLDSPEVAPLVERMERAAQLTLAFGGAREPRPAATGTPAAPPPAPRPVPRPDPRAHEDYMAASVWVVRVRMRERRGSRYWKWS